MNPQSEVFVEPVPMLWPDSSCVDPVADTLDALLPPDPVRAKLLQVLRLSCLCGFVSPDELGGASLVFEFVSL